MKYRFERYCKDYENIENYEKALADNFKNWDCHHRLETHNSDGERRLVDITRKELMALNIYWHRPAEELIFLTTSEHQFLHHKGKHPSEESKKKMGEASKGKKFSEEHKKKLSEAWDYDKHFNEEARRRISETLKGKNIWSKCTHWYNNGKINTMAKECPQGFVPGRIKKL